MSGRHRLLALVVGLQLQTGLLAPAGTLRAGFLADNPVQGQVDPTTKEVSGPVVDLVKELARRLGVPYTIVPLPNAQAVIESVGGSRVDIGFLAYESARARQVDFSDPYAIMQSAYLVRTDSPIRRSSDVDRPGVRVGAIAGQSPQIFVSEALKQARVDVLPTTPTPMAIADMVVNHQIDAFAANRARMEAVATMSPELRVLTDNFLSVGQAIVVRKGGDSARVELLNRFVSDVVASGLVKTWLEHARIAGVDVAPLASR